MLIVNPQAGGGSRAATVERIVETVAPLGWRLDVRETAARGDATRLAAEAAARGLPAVFAAGGDGTLNEVIQGLAGSETALAALPFGTINIWARELGLPRDPVEAVRDLVLGQVRRVDLGRVNGRYFLLMAGLGFDAEAVYAVEGEPKRRFGPLALFLAGLLAALRTQGSHLRVQADDSVFVTSAALVTVGNTRLWGGAVKITHRATAADGLLDVCFFPGRALHRKLWHLALVVAGRHEVDPEVTYVQVRRLVIAARPPLPLHVDGESFGTTPARIEVMPGAIRALVGTSESAVVAGAPVDTLLAPTREQV
jgi:YegS/Rv2252/BmrU family lipid kinase